jgi:hypothetical protein
MPEKISKMLKLFKTNIRIVFRGRPNNNAKTASESNLAFTPLTKHKFLKLTRINLEMIPTKLPLLTPKNNLLIVGGTTLLFTMIPNTKTSLENISATTKCF